MDMACAEQTMSLLLQAILEQGQVARQGKQPLAGQGQHMFDGQR